MTLATVLVITAIAGAPAPQAAAPPQRPRAELTAVTPSAPIERGSRVTLTLQVRLPEGIHVQADKPRDPLLIATTLTLTPPDGVTVDRIVFPQGTDFAQAGQSKPLLVFGSDFVVSAQVTVTSAAPAGEIKIPAVLRYQACNERVCFAPARAQAAWTLTAR